MDSIAHKDLLWCLLCDEKFSLDDVEAGDYIGATGICVECYRKMAKDVQTCFGKEELYDEGTLECSTFCPDRTICGTFAKKSIQKRNSKSEGL